LNLKIVLRKLPSPSGLKSRCTKSRKADF